MNNRRWWWESRFINPLLPVRLHQEVKLICLGTNAFHCCNETPTLLHFNQRLCTKCQVAVNCFKKKRSKKSGSSRVYIRRVVYRKDSDQQDFTPYINRYITVKQLLLESNLVICQHCSRDVDVFRTSDPQLCTVCYAAYNRRRKSSIDKENVPDGEHAQFTLDPSINTNGHTGPDELLYDKATSAGGDSGRALVCLFGRSSNAGENKIQPDFGLAATLANKLVEARLEWNEDKSIMLPRERTYKLVGKYHGNGMFKASMMAKKSAMKDYRTYANVPNDLQQWNVQDEDYILLTGLHPAAFGTGNPLYVLEYLFAVSLRVNLHQVYMVFLGHTTIDGKIDNATTVVNAEDLVKLLRFGIYPQHFGKCEHLLKYLHACWHGLHVRDDAGINLHRNSGRLSKLLVSEFGSHNNLAEPQ
ncbi:hypothetical protein MP228_005448 [Amoeboaphelidium protococcarum]|nr:hypothetical protein MP228_005448 [Amoeboaphelidium protococcarum]